MELVMVCSDTMTELSDEQISLSSTQRFKIAYCSRSARPKHDSAVSRSAVLEKQLS